MKQPIAWFSILTLAVAILAEAGQGGQGGIHRNPNAIKDEYIVVLEDTVPASQVDNVAEELGRQHHGAVRGTWKNAIRGFLMVMNAARAEALSHNPKVAFVEENAILYPSTSQDTYKDPETGNTTTDNRLWHLDRIDQVSADLDQTYHYCTTGSGVVVYVVDYGVMAAHSEFLPNQVTVGVNTSGDDPIRYPANNPCNGWPSPVNYDLNDEFFLKYREAVLNLGHGTSVASLVAGQKVGVAKNATIVPVKFRRCDTNTARAWQSGHNYQVNDLIYVPQNGARYWKCSTAGMSGSSLPSFPAAGFTQADNQVTWTNVGQTPTAVWEENHPYHVGDLIYVANIGYFFRCSGVTGSGSSGGSRPTFEPNTQTVSDNEVTWMNATIHPPSSEGNIATMIAGIDWIVSSANPNFVAGTTSIATFSVFGVLGYPDFSALETAVKSLTSHGIAVFASANNQNDDLCNTTPGRLSRFNPTESLRDKVITVGGSMPAEVGGVKKDARWVIPSSNNDDSVNRIQNYETPDFETVNGRKNYSDAMVGSNYGACVTLFAPARRIASARFTAADEYRDRLGLPGDTPIPPFASGTSFASPLAAGSAARFLQWKTNASVDEIYNALINSASQNLMLDSTTFPLGAGSPNLLLRATDVWIYDEWPKPFFTLSGDEVVLTVSAAGPPTLSYQWYRGNPGDTTNGAGTGAQITVSPTLTTTYWVRVSSPACADAVSVDSRAATVTVTTQTVVEAHATAATTIRVSWTSVPGATGYQVFRAEQGSPFNPNSPILQTTNSTTLDYDDGGRTPEKGYAYKVRPKFGTTPGPFSKVDYATTVTFTSSSAILATQIAELRRAVNEIARAVGITTDPFPSNLTTESSVKFDANGDRRVISAADVSAVMEKINEVRGNNAYNNLQGKAFQVAPAGHGTCSPTDCDLIKNTQLTDLLDAVK